MDKTFWSGSINLFTPTVKLLQTLADSLPKDREFKITVFGDAVLQICIDASLPCARIEVFSDFELLGDFVETAQWRWNKHPLFIQVCHELNFQTSVRWRDRALTARIENCTFVFPHPIDILIAKLNRLDGKDMRVFQTVLAKTGHPMETELIRELQFTVDLFRPRFEQDSDSEMSDNCRWLWPLIYGREIDPRAEIIAPALAIRKAGYGEPARDYKQELRDALKETA